MNTLEIILTILAASGWSATILLLRRRAELPTYPAHAHAEARMQRVAFLRRRAMELLECSVDNTRGGYPYIAQNQRIESDRMFAEADALDPPVPPGGAPGRLSPVPNHDSTEEMP